MNITSGTGQNSGAITISTANAAGTSKTAGDINVTGGTSTNGIAGCDINVTAGTGGSTNGVGGVSTIKGGHGCRRRRSLRAIPRPKKGHLSYRC